MHDEELQSRLRASTRFARLVHAAACTSTQDLAAADPDTDAAVFRADHQTTGRGRQRREWHDEPGADLLVTFRLRLPRPLPNPIALPAVVPLCVLQAGEPLVGRELRIKWPNDVLCDGKKLAGVLIDAGAGGADVFLVGIGLNGNRTRFPRDLEGTATSLALASGKEHDLGALLLVLAQRLDAALAALADSAVATLEALFRARLGLMQQQVVVQAGAQCTGRLTGLDFEQLVLDGSRSFPLGQVQAIRAALV